MILAVFFGFALGLVGGARTARIAATSGRRPLRWGVGTFVVVCALGIATARTALAFDGASGPVTPAMLVGVPVTAIVGWIAMSLLAARRPAESIVFGIRIPSDVCLGVDRAAGDPVAAYRASALPFQPCTLVLTEATLGFERPTEPPDLVAHRSVLAIDADGALVVLRWTRSDGTTTGAIVRTGSAADADSLARRLRRLRPSS